MWSQWLSADAIKTFLHGGYYTVYKSLLTNKKMLAEPGLRIVSLNMEYCDVDNLWVEYNEGRVGLQAS